MGLASQEDFFSSPEDAPALKRQRTLTTLEVKDIRTKVLVIEQPANDDVGVEVTEGNRSMDDEEEAMPLTFHTKEDLLRKLQSLHHLPRGKRFKTPFWTVLRFQTNYFSFTLLPEQGMVSLWNPPE